MLLVIRYKAPIESSSDRLKSVAEWSVPNIVHKARGQSGLPLNSFLRGSGRVEINDTHQLTGGMKDTQRMGKPCVGGARVHEFTEAKLPYSAQTLKWRGLNDAPQHAFEPISLIKLDQVMERVPNSLTLEFCHKICSIYVLVRFQGNLSIEHDAVA